MKEDKNKRRKECEKNIVRILDSRGAIRWGLATSLKYIETMEFMIDQFLELQKYRGK